MSRACHIFAMVLAPLVGCGSPAPPAPQPAPPAKGTAEAERLNGTWRVVSIVAAGRPVPKEKVDALQLDWVFDGDRVTTKRPDRPADPGTFTADPTVVPKRLTINKPGLPAVRAVYELDGATLKLCLMVDENPSAGFPPEVTSTTAPKTDLLTLERR